MNLTSTIFVSHVQSHAKWIISKAIFNISKLFFLYFTYMSVLPEFVHHIHAWRLQRPEESTGFPRTVITKGCHLPCGCWEKNVAPPEEQQVLLVFGL